MTIYRLFSSKESDIPPAIPWRHTRTPSVGSIPNLHQSNGFNPRKGTVVFQSIAIAFLLIYIFLPSHSIRKISSKASLNSVSEAGRNVLFSLSEVVSTISSDGTSANSVGIVAACMNRQDTLRKVLPTWLSVEGVSEIILVDWGSDPPLRPIVNPERDSRLKLLRVSDEDNWVLSRAYNLAMNTSTKDYVIRTDCDYSLGGAILEAHNLSETETGFYSGNWMLARNENEVHLNGAMVIKRSVFWDVGGYDERIQTYGWDDEDLYNRLSSNKIAKLNISYDHVSHVSHGDGKRAQTGVKFAQVQIDLNQLLLERLPQWSSSFINTDDSTRYKVIDEDKGYAELKAVHIPKALRHRVSPEEYEESWSIALGRRLADDYYVPWDVLETLDIENKEKLLRSLMKLQDDLGSEIESRSLGKQGADNKKILPTHARILFVHCMHGLGNRMRAIGSALSFAENTRRVPVIIWESDAHIAAEFDALFNTSQFVVMEKFNPKWPFSKLSEFDAAWKHFDCYNYMEMEEGGKKGEMIVNNPEKHLYYKGAYIMESPEHTWWEADNEKLRSLIPVQMVQRHLRELEEQSLSQAVGVHIRNRTLGADIKNVNFVNEYGSEAVSTMEYWRQQSSYRSFIGEMKRIIAKDSEVKFYIATDTYEIIGIMEGLFPGRILSTKRSCDDRDSECVRYAIIDMYALSKTKQLLGSNWSSYTEMAERLSGLKARLAGQDFKVEEEEVVVEALDEETEKSEEELDAEEQDRLLDLSNE